MLNKLQDVRGQGKTVEPRSLGSRLSRSRLSYIRLATIDGLQPADATSHDADGCSVVPDWASATWYATTWFSATRYATAKYDVSGSQSDNDDGSYPSSTVPDATANANADATSRSDYVSTIGNKCYRCWRPRPEPRSWLCSKQWSTWPVLC